MKTNQIMVRLTGDFKVTQRTKDGFFNATELLKRWNEKSGMKKELKHYFENQSSNELINTIVERENLKYNKHGTVKDYKAKILG